MVVICKMTTTMWISDICWLWPYI